MSSNFPSYLQRAQALAHVMHDGQEYDGQPFYQGHLKHVASIVEHITKDPDAIAVAYLHDIVEDTPMTLGQLREMGFPDHIVSAVSFLTRDAQHEPYATYIQLLEVSPGRAGQLARLVKYADLTFNRLNCLSDPHYRGLVSRYTEALARIQPAVLRDFKELEGVSLGDA